jgi:hypothetical protein
MALNIRFPSDVPMSAGGGKADKAADLHFDTVVGVG